MSAARAAIFTLVLFFFCSKNITSTAPQRHPMLPTAHYNSLKPGQPPTAPYDPYSPLQHPTVPYNSQQTLQLLQFPTAPIAPTIPYSPYNSLQPLQPISTPYYPQQLPTAPLYDSLPPSYRRPTHSYTNELQITKQRLAVKCNSKI